MCSNEKDKVFKAKVLKRLYGSDSEEEKQHVRSTSAAEDTKLSTSPVLLPLVATSQKVYSVTPPPAGVQLISVDPTLYQDRGTSTSSESSSEEEIKGNKRRKPRHRKRKRGTQDCLNSNGKILPSCERDTVVKAHSSLTVSSLTKNQKRKLKKKRQKQRKDLSIGGDKSQELTIQELMKNKKDESQ